MLFCTGLWAVFTHTRGFMEKILPIATHVTLLQDRPTMTKQIHARKKMSEAINDTDEI